ncbi:MAG TPA: hexose-6-phosphate:phosphate antiporter [Labilithrix sp.]|jgi:OPA family hexose phosphate transport protein UhpT-like MFS transporter|nr:hexose-6-phosphate:phosphate antiporter [Labilithrix sp.]
MIHWLELKRPPKLGLDVGIQRRRWLGEFLKAFVVVFVGYLTMYLIRNNFKAASGSLKSEMGWTTTQLAAVGVAFSIAYGLGKTVLGYLVDGKNTKCVVSVLLTLSGVVVVFMGLGLAARGVPIAVFMILWGVNGVFQSVGGPAAYSTITRWTPRTVRGRWLGLWNVSHNIGGGLAGGVALFGAQALFDGHVYGMFLFPAAIAVAVGVLGLFGGRDDPEELGWDRAEVIFGEPVETDNTAAEGMSKWLIFRQYVLGNRWIWLLSISNVFVYVVRIGVDNWSVLYSQEHLGFSKADAVHTLFYFELGALVASACWGYVSDLVGGRRAAVAAACLVATLLAISAYRRATSVAEINVALFSLGALIFGPQLLIGVSLVGFVPKRSVSVANGMTGTFGYLFGDAAAKVGLAAIADPSQGGLHLLGVTLRGWGDTFVVLYAAAIAGVALLVVVAFGEERRLRALRREALDVAPLADDKRPPA